MKTLFVPFSIAVMIFSLLTVSCGPGKNTHASKPSSTTIKKDTAAVTSKKTETTIPKNESIDVPPVDIRNNFTTRYPDAKNISWNKQLNDESSQIRYTVEFIENDQRIWIIYSENGAVLEERQEIVVNQLPQNIYNTVKEKYATYKIVSAATYKHVSKEGSYAILLKPSSSSDMKEIEVIFRENASIVE